MPASDVCEGGCVFVRICYLFARFSSRAIWLFLNGCSWLTFTLVAAVVASLERGDGSFEEQKLLSWFLIRFL